MSMKSVKCKVIIQEPAYTSLHSTCQSDGVVLGYDLTSSSSWFPDLNDAHKETPDRGKRSGVG